MKCFWRTKRGTWCKNPGGRTWPFCHKHKSRLPIALLSIGLVLGAIRSDILLPIMDQIVGDTTSPITKPIPQEPHLNTRIADLEHKLDRLANSAPSNTTGSLNTDGRFIAHSVEPIHAQQTASISVGLRPPSAPTGLRVVSY